MGFFVFILLSVASAFESPLGDLGGGPAPRPRLSVSNVWSMDDSIENRKADARIPVWKSESSQFSVGLRDHVFRLSDELRLPGSSVIVPKELRSSELSLGYSTRRGEQEFVGGRFSFGSASDRAFEGSRTTSVGATVFWSYPSRESPSRRWILSLNYSNNNSFTTLPIPGFAYSIQEEGFIGVFGLPFAFVRWVPWPDRPWTVTCFYLLTTLNAEIAYGPPFMNVFARFDWGQETWMRADRERLEDRLTYDEKRALVGGRMPVTKWLMLEGEAGFAFERSFFEGKSRFKKSTGDRFLDQTGYSKLSLRAVF